ncbi:MAG: hypothetical protein WD845_15600 [Pirellulales bacterium]
MAINVVRGRTGNAHPGARSARRGDKKPPRFATFVLLGSEAPHRSAIRQLTLLFLHRDRAMSQPVEYFNGLPGALRTGNALGPGMEKLSCECYQKAKDEFDRLLG